MVLYILLMRTATQDTRDVWRQRYLEILSVPQALTEDLFTPVAS